MGGKARARKFVEQFACWLCYDTGQFQDWGAPWEGEYCSCWRGKLAKQEAKR